jgi:hypothetical protein
VVLDNYCVIPLAKSLKNVRYGVSSDEYLNYARKQEKNGNRRGKKL